MIRSRNRRSSQTSKGTRTRIVPHQIINAQAACPRPLARAALLGLPGLVSLIVSPWTGVVLILVAGTVVALTLLPWGSWLPRKQLPPS